MRRSGRSGKALFGWSRALLLGAAAACATALAPAPAATASPVAFTTEGPVAGQVVSGMREFLGIRYAAAPTGDFRWKPPRRPGFHIQTFQATQFGNHCPQPASPFGLASATEDCLFLNVYAPDKIDILRPVMFWIHGGALVVGESDDYDPSRLVAQGVIVVTINYRLGALGFLAHPALTAESPGQNTSGDYGIEDQQFALDWVHRNIIFFGGNPENITVFGESAGGLSTFSNLVSPLTKGKFQRAIVESGAYRLTLPSLATAEAQGVTYATAEGCPGTNAATAACLRALTVAQVLAKENAAGYVPNTDGVVLPNSIATALKNGQFNRVPVMNGSNHDEWRLFVALNNVIPIILGGGGPAQIAAAINPTTFPNLIAGTLGIPVALTAPIVALYPPGATTLSTELALGALGTDAIFACPAHFADELTSQFVPTFAYEFNDENAPQNFLPFVGFPYGAAHASEIQYLFGVRNGAGVPVVPLNADQQKLSAQMVKYWTEFAEGGNPNEAGSPNWPKFVTANDDMQSLTPPTPSTEFNFTTVHNCAFWDAAATAAGRPTP